MDLQHQRAPGNFFREPEDRAGPATRQVFEEISAGPLPGHDDRPRILFQRREWDFPDAPLRGLYARHRVYQSVAGMDAFEPWIERLEKRITEAMLGEEAEQIPPEWYQDDWTRSRVCSTMYARRKRYVT